jgi:hypothetical protein
MPYSIRKIGKNRYQVYNTATGELHSKGTSKKKAEGQFRLLQGIARKEVIGLEGGGQGQSTTARALQLVQRQDVLMDRIEELQSRLNQLTTQMNRMEQLRNNRIERGTQTEALELQYLRGRNDLIDRMRETQRDTVGLIEEQMAVEQERNDLAVEQDMLNELANMSDDDDMEGGGSGVSSLYRADPIQRVRDAVAVYSGIPPEDDWDYGNFADVPRWTRHINRVVDMLVNRYGYEYVMDTPTSRLDDLIHEGLGGTPRESMGETEEQSREDDERTRMMREDKNVGRGRYSISSPQYQPRRFL